MVMTLLVGRVIYLLFDSLANGLVWAGKRLFGLRPEQLGWLVGEYREEAKEKVEDGSRDGTADRSTEFEQVHAQRRKRLMKATLWNGGLICVGFAALAFVVTGCTKQDSAPKADGKSKSREVAENTDKKGHDHSGWWCVEHGIPEEMCSMCSDKVAKEYKAKGDWCEKHERADSQCFICHPEFKEKFAAMYRAKYGKEPPPIEDEKKDETKKDETKKDETKKDGSK